MKRSFLAVLALLGAGCATTSNRSLTEIWGGQHVGLVMSDAGGRLEYDCAAGTIDPGILGHLNKRFSASGTHTPGHGGPDRIGHVPPSYPAGYSGRIEGDTMTLIVDVPALATRLGPYTLRRDTAPTLMRCL